VRFPVGRGNEIAETAGTGDRYVFYQQRACDKQVFRILRTFRNRFQTRICWSLAMSNPYYLVGGAALTAGDDSIGLVTLDNKDPVRAARSRLRVVSFGEIEAYMEEIGETIDPANDDWSEQIERLFKEPDPKDTPSPFINALPSTSFDDVGNYAKKNWLLKGAIAKGETSMWIAPPKRLKSALMTDISIAVASGTDWRGYKSKQKCGVVYFALERGDLVKRRFDGHRMRDRLEGLPIEVVSKLVNLMDVGSVTILEHTIREIERKKGFKIGFGVIDTLAKGIAFGGGDENQAKDMGRALANLRKVQELTGVHIAIVHHTGKDQTRGARGSNSQVGDVDMLVQIKGDQKVKEAIITDANDQAEGLLTKFVGEVVTLGLDEDGEERTTMIISAEDCGSATTTTKSAAKPKILSHRDQRGMDLLIKAINEEGRPPPANLPRSVVKVVPLDIWRDYCKRGALAGGETDDAFRMAFKRTSESLVTKRRIEIFDGLVWVAYGENVLDFNSAPQQ
jgi:AAA domain